MSESEPSPTSEMVAQTTMYTAPSGALVFDTGTLGWEYALSRRVPRPRPTRPGARSAGWSRSRATC